MQARLMSDARLEESRDEACLGLMAMGLTADEIAEMLERAALEVLAAVDRAKATRPAMERREMRVQWELHKSVAEKLDENPSPIIASALVHAAAMKERQRSPMGKRWMTEWEDLLLGNLEDLKLAMLATGFHAEDMRQMSPFLGVLTQAERVLAIYKAGQTAPV